MPSTDAADPFFRLHSQTAAIIQRVLCCRAGERLGTLTFNTRELAVATVQGVDCCKACLRQDHSVGGGRAAHMDPSGLLSGSHRSFLGPLWAPSWMLCFDLLCIALPLSSRARTRAREHAHTHTQPLICTALFGFVFALLCVALLCTALQCFAFLSVLALGQGAGSTCNHRHITQHSTAHHSNTKHSTALISTAQNSTSQHTNAHSCAFLPLHRSISM